MKQPLFAVQSAYVVLRSISVVYDLCCRHSLELSELLLFRRVLENELGGVGGLIAVVQRSLSYHGGMERVLSCCSKLFISWA